MKKIYILISIILILVFDVIYYHQTNNKQNTLSRADDGSNLGKRIDCDFFRDNEEDKKQLSDSTDNTVALKMIKVKGGCFLMGNWPQIGSTYEMQTLACLSDFMLGQTEVTQELWYEVMGNGPGNFKGCGKDFPMTQFSWDDLQIFLKRLNQKMHRNYRLPTEEEWEYACRSQGMTTTYCGDDDIDSIAWHRYNGRHLSYHRVSQKRPNSLGFYDMSGNVWELTSSCDLNDCSKHIIRGGSSFYEPSCSKSYTRMIQEALYPSTGTGFRLAHDIRIN